MTTVSLPCSMAGVGCAVLMVLSLMASAAPVPDLIESIPMYGDITGLPFRLFGGSVVASPPGESRRNLYYVIAESQRNPSSDPVVLWQTGGPGISAFWWEHGPFTMGPPSAESPDQVSITLNPFAWNRVATVIYMDSPCGVGYSTFENGNANITYKHYNDSTTTEDTYRALQALAQLHPELLERDFYVFGESYAGIYVPLISERIHQGRSTFPLRLQGYGVGNGEIDGNDLVGILSSRFQQMYWRAIITAQEYASLMACLPLLQSGNPGQACDTLANQAWTNTFYINPYHINGWCEQGGPSDPPCFSSAYLAAYMNREDVKTAFRAPQNAVYTLCSDYVGEHYHRTCNDSSAVTGRMLSTGLYRVLQYSGDADAIVPWQNTWKWVQPLGTAMYGATPEWTEWVYQNTEHGLQAGGMVTRFGSKFTFTTVLRAGHLVPMDAPQAALHMFASFLDGNPLCGAAATPSDCTCSAGWFGPGNCSAPICSSAECHDTQGVCVAPGVCACKPGFDGATCQSKAQSSCSSTDAHSSSEGISVAVFVVVVLVALFAGAALVYGAIRYGVFRKQSDTDERLQLGYNNMEDY